MSKSNKGDMIASIVPFCLLLLLVYKSANTVDINEYFQGKRIILTGASKGIGRELAIQFASLGAKLIVAARTASKLEETVQLCKKVTTDVFSVVADVSKKEDCQAVIDAAVKKFGGVDILILNAAFSFEPKWFSQFDNPGEVFDNVFRVNVLQSVYLIHFGLQHLINSHGIVVGVSSAASQIGMPQVLPYSSSKHGLNGLRQEFYITNTPVTVTIFPLPFVHTEKALSNWKPTGTTHGIPPKNLSWNTSCSLRQSVICAQFFKDCAQKMIQVIPYRYSWSYVDWSSTIIGRLYSLFPELIDFCVRQYLPYMSNLFE